MLETTSRKEATFAGVGPRVLVAQSHPKIAGYISTGLRDEGYVVEVAHAGGEARRHALTRDFDALVLELALPEYGGMEIVTELRELGRSTPVLLTGGGWEAETVARHLWIPGVAVLQLPFGFWAVLKELTGLLRAAKHRPGPRRWRVGHGTPEMENS